VCTKPLVQTTGRRKRGRRPRPPPSRQGTITVNGVRRGLLPDRRPPDDPHRAAPPHRDRGAYDVDATIHGGGVTGQAGALRLGIARALIELDPELRGRSRRPASSPATPRKKESKKYGLKKARKAPQYSKR
jgi:small subunit ribosomal protein S9